MAADVGADVGADVAADVDADVAAVGAGSTAAAKNQNDTGTPDFDAMGSKILQRYINPLNIAEVY